MELLLVIVILAIIGGVVATAIVVSGRSTAQTSREFNESHDAQLTSAYLGADVQDAAAITSATCYPSLTNLLNFVYDDSASVASYYYGTADGETKLVRRFCDNGGNLIADVTLAHNLGSTAPVFVCKDSAGTVIACSPGSKPDSVKLTLTETDGYTYSLSASRRIYAGVGNPLIRPRFPCC